LGLFNAWRCDLNFSFQCSHTAQINNIFSFCVTTVEQLAQQNISPLCDLDQVSLLVVLRDAEQVIMSQIMSPNETAGCQAQRSAMSPTQLYNAEYNRGAS
jgi:hypothetical protein